MVSPDHDRHPPGLSLTDRLRRDTGLDPAACYQCGKCSAGCPMASETRFRPHDVMRMINNDSAEELLADESIWLCLTCETCTARCPNGCDPARMIDALRELAAERAPRPIRAFHEAFLSQVRAHGRLFELGLVLGYKLRTGALLQDAETTPALLARGKLKLAPRAIRGVNDVRRIFAACRRAGEAS